MTFPHKKPALNIWSQANSSQAHGVKTAYLNFINHIVPRLCDYYDVKINVKREHAINHIWTINPEFLYWLKSLKKTSIANLMHVHFYQFDGDLNGFLTKVLNFYLYKFYQTTDHYIIVNPEMVNQLYKKIYVLKDNCTFIPNFVSKSLEINLKASELKSFQEKYNISKHDFVVIGVGQLNYRKGIEDFVATARRLKGEKIKFFWIGGYSFYKRVYSNYKSINLLINKNYNNLTFCDIVPPKEMPFFYQSANLFFMPSHWEGMPMSLLEASAFQVPLLLRNIVPFKLFLPNYLTGTDPKSFANSILSLKNNHQLQTKMSTASHDIFNMYSNIDDVFMRYHQLYQRFLLAQN